MGSGMKSNRTMLGWMSWLAASFTFFSSPVAAQDSLQVHDLSMSPIQLATPKDLPSRKSGAESAALRKPRQASRLFVPVESGAAPAAPPEDRTLQAVHGAPIDAAEEAYLKQ